MKKHYRAIITIECFMDGVPMPPKGARNIVYIFGLNRFFMFSSRWK